MRKKKTYAMKRGGNVKPRMMKKGGNVKPRMMKKGGSIKKFAPGGKVTKGAATKKTVKKVKRPRQSHQAIRIISRLSHDAGHPGPAIHLFANHEAAS